MNPNNPDNPRDWPAQGRREVFQLKKLAELPGEPTDAEIILEGLQKEEDLLRKGFGSERHQGHVSELSNIPPNAQNRGSSAAAENEEEL